MDKIDWILAAAVVLSAVLNWLSRQHALPRGARRVLRKIGKQRIVSLINQAAEMRDLSRDERRRWVATKLQDLAVSRLGVRLPLSTANLLVEFVYQQVRRRLK